MLVIKKNKQFNFPTLTEWLEKTKTADYLKFVKEDNLKYDRLEKLKSIINLKYNVPQKLIFSDIEKKTKKFKEVQKKMLDTDCNLRIIPKKSTYSKKRIRKINFEKGLEWLKKQKVDKKNYKRIEIIKNDKNTVFSTAFLINNFGIWGEYVIGEPDQLVSGLCRKKPILFVFNFQYQKWNFSKKNTRIENIIKEAINPLKISSPEIQEKLRDRLNSEFTSKGYIKGYFEFVVWPKKRYYIWIIIER